MIHMSIYSHRFRFELQGCGVATQKPQANLPNLVMKKIDTVPLTIFNQKSKTINQDMIPIRFPTRLRISSDLLS